MDNKRNSSGRTDKNINVQTLSLECEHLSELSELLYGFGERKLVRMLEGGVQLDSSIVHIERSGNIISETPTYKMLPLKIYMERSLEIPVIEVVGKALGASLFRKTETNFTSTVDLFGVEYIKEIYTFIIDQKEPWKDTGFVRLGTAKISSPASGDIKLVDRALVEILSVIVEGDITKYEIDIMSKYEIDVDHILTYISDGRKISHGQTQPNGKCIHVKFICKNT